MSNHLSPGNQTSNHSTPQDCTQQAHDIGDIRYFIDGYVLHHKSQQHSRQIIATCVDRLGKFVWFLEHEGYPLDLEQISSAHIRAFFVYLQEQRQERWGSTNPGANKPLSQATANAYGRVLRAFFRWTAEEAGIRNPFTNVKLPRVPNAWQIHVLDDDQIATLFKACDRSGTPFLVARNRTILAILLDTGARSCELLGLKVGAAQLAARFFHLALAPDQRRARIGKIV